MGLNFVTGDRFFVRHDHPTVHKSGSGQDIFFTSRSLRNSSGDLLVPRREFSKSQTRRGHFFGPDSPPFSRPRDTEAHSRPDTISSERHLARAASEGQSFVRPFTTTISWISLTGKQISRQLSHSPRFLTRFASN